MEFNLDLSQLERALKKSPEAVGKALLTGLTDVKNDWKAESVDIAPIDKRPKKLGGTLRRSIEAEVFTEGDGAGVEITANATRGPRRFNYAYYIHEGNGNAITGEKKFLDKPAMESKEKWRQWMEKEIQSELRKAGW
ncbi:hypothetical protein ABE61_22655 [Lysinibacillus sphaericus]|uniref:hypothetical protein n=1 Tax=Lysinibacillus sphaericus TaxID=1421 RepID=UPI0018CDC8B6|nr:hypothetical protein [Lysinibacillus sphaericus]MBG9456734.1 hypothetical protein [Lysinibacillus sphaericus]MBG9476898.1 hypothetical protein [Lysinibacillus sphaericus]MBG9591447.1 hypothetical protein [Lysinibacillus sphaericus]